jgi:hypothetical protein
MKRLTLLSAMLLLFLFGFSQIKAQENFAFKRGEKLVFRVYYDSFLTGKVTAGEATLEVTSDNKVIGGRPTFHVIGTGRSKGAFNLFFKVIDRFESFFDEETFSPLVFIRRTREGGYKKDDDVTFLKNKGIAISRKKTTPIANNVYDFLSAYYWARNIDVTKYNFGESALFSFFLDDTTYASKIQFVQKENVKIELGKFKTIKIMPGVAKGNVFNDEYPIEVWVSDDKNRVPILAQSKIIVGKVKMELVSYSGLANPLTSKIE